MGLMISDSGLLMLRNNKLFVDANGTDCCCACVCNCVALTNAWNTVDVLTVSITYPAACGGGPTGDTLNPSVGSVPASKAGCYHWGNTFTNANFPDYDLVVWCDGDSIGAEVSESGTANCSASSVAVTSLNCDNGAETFSATLEIDIASGGGTPDPCPCTGGTITVQVSYP